MSSPEQKAKELLDEIEGVLCGSLPMVGEPYLSETKAIALICVEEILESIDNDPVLIDCDYPRSYYPNEEKLEYFQKVKEEIQKL